LKKKRRKKKSARRRRRRTKEGRKEGRKKEQSEKKEKKNEKKKWNKLKIKYLLSLYNTISMLIIIKILNGFKKLLFRRRKKKRERRRVNECNYNKITEWGSHGLDEYNIGIGWEWKKELKCVGGVIILNPNLIQKRMNAMLFPFSNIFESLTIQYYFYFYFI
jgi:hypothetical protein